LKYFDSLTNAHLQIDDSDIKAYHEVCEKEYSMIRFTGISGAESKRAQSIDEFYVENTFSCFNRELENFYADGSDVLDSIALKDFFKYSNKIVLIGGAGLGKSTALNYLFCKYKQLYHLNALKIKIDLKEYAKDVGEDKKDLLWCLASEFYKKIKRTKVDFTGAEKLLAKYLNEGRCLIILDALDEIPKQSVRNKVRDEIGRFCDIYYLNRFIITTREAGYLRNRFDETFLHIRINQFTDKQIRQYSQNWFKSNYDELARLIIEIVIQNDEPRQHKYLINYMLDALQEDGPAQSGKQCIFDILADLYGHNMLQPKFHTKYYECILYHPEYAARYSRLSSIHLRAIYAQADSFSLYDSRILAAMFAESVNQNGLANVLNAVYFLNNEFKQHVRELIQEDYLVHITRLFSACFEITENRIRNLDVKAKGKNYELELNYFLSPAGLSYTLQYPEIFICVMDLILTIGRGKKITELLNCKFEANSQFFKYTGINILCGLFSVSCASPEHVLITLLLLVHCAKGRTNIAFWHIFRRLGRWADEEYGDMVNNAKFLWDVLNDSETFEQFRDMLLARGLYDVKYEELYKKLYRDYADREKQLHQDKINEFQMPH